MPPIVINPGDSVREAFGDARPGDDIEIVPARYPAGTAQLVTPSQVTIRARGWRHGMSVLPSADRGLPVMIEGRLTIGASCDVDGVGVDSSKALAASGSVMIDGNENHIRDLWITNRNAAGVGSIALTIGVPTTFGGRGPAHDFSLDAFQIVRFGTPGNVKHQGVYDKLTRGAKVRNGLIRLGPMFGLHAFPDARGSEYERIIVDLCGAGLVCSSQDDASTGVADPGTTGIYAHHLCITRATRAGNFLVESQWDGGNTPAVPCRLEDAIVWRGGQPGGRFEGGLSPHVQMARILDVDPRYRDTGIGDYRVPADSPAADKVPVWLVDGAVPPPPDPGPDPAPPPSQDTSGPVMAWVRPAEGAVLAGPLLYTVTAADPAGVAWVEFRLKGAGVDQLLFRELSAPWGETPFDTTRVPDGPYTLTATARDAVGNETTITRAVTVANTPTPPPPPDPSDPCAGIKAERDAAVMARLAAEAARDDALGRIARARAALED
ncbi:Ig-like domain-containing protein [Miltoncostaea oceani]|uniref:Ig-like domain-containing protein n=1 Tax=Miltoncostaea oceani TaxID=2843216 RepID=UPI001C3DD5C6|nr:Ig-like domain-containing protein [Miltoncostaea oceani]